MCMGMKIQSNARGSRGAVKQVKGTKLGTGDCPADELLSFFSVLGLEFVIAYEIKFSLVKEEG